MMVFHDFVTRDMAIIITNAMAESLDDNADNWQEQHNILHAMLLQCSALGIDRNELNWDVNHHLDRYLLEPDIIDSEQTVI